MNNKKQIYNPFLPSYEYIPDGEVHVFGDRVYLYGSHDRCHGAHFCLNDYVCYSADINDLTDWKYEGVIYRKDQDPRNQNIPTDAKEIPLMPGIEAEKPENLNPRGVHAMYAPDVVQGLDSRYYLYYCLDILPEIAVAVCDTPAGEFEFLGFVRYSDGTILGTKEGDFFQFDPGLFIDEDGTIYLYSGGPVHKKYIDATLSSQVMTLEVDMLTLKTAPRKLLPSVFEGEGTGFEGHEFFEASSIRKINGKYYFVYSSINSHELCYAISDYPDKDYKFGGTIVSIGDIYLNGRTNQESVNYLGNTHGCIEKVGHQWYVFYHRQTNRTNFSRQACAEKIIFDDNGHIQQVEVTSCGLNNAALNGKGKYPANICCHLTGKEGAKFSHPLIMKLDYPFLTQDLSDTDVNCELTEKDLLEPIQYIRNIKDGSVAGYKYFEFKDVNNIVLEVRGIAKGKIQVLKELNGEELGEIDININSSEWEVSSGTVNIPDGISSLYFLYKGEGSLDLRSFIFNNLEE